MRAARMPALILAVLAAAATPAAAQVQVPAKRQTVSLDSDAPPGSPPHWLPGEPWVMQHWLPYLRPTKGSSTRSDAFITLLCA